MKRLGLLAAAAVVLALPAAAQPQPQTEAAFRTTTLNLSAQAQVRAEPDIAYLTVGVSTEAATAQQASAEAGQRLNAVVAALRQAGVAQRDIQTGSVNLFPRYADRTAAREIVAHQASASVTVTVRDLARAGAMLDVAVRGGANQVQGVRFALSEPAGAQRRARDQALRALQQEAEEIAATMGYRVARLVNVNTQAYSDIVLSGSRIPPLGVPPVAQREMNFEPGELTVRAGATGVFELAPR